MLAVLSELSARTEVAELLRTATEPPLSNFAPQVVGVLKQLEAQLATSHTASTSIGHCVALVAQCRRQLGAAAQKGRRRVRSIVSHLPAPLPRLPQPSSTPVRSNPSLRDALLKGASLKGAAGVGAPAAVSSHSPAPVVPVQPAAEGGGTPASVSTSVAAVAPTLGTVSSNAGASKDGQDGAAAGAGAGNSATTSVSTAIGDAVTAQGGETSRGVAPAAPVDSGAVDVASDASSAVASAVTHPSPAGGRHLDLSQASANTSASHGRESEIDLCGDTGSDEDMTPAAVATTPDADRTDAPVAVAQPTPSTGGGHHSPAARDASVVIVVSSDESDGEQLLRKRQRLKRRRRCVVSSGSDSDSDADSSVHATTVRTRTKGDSDHSGDDGSDSDGVVVQETSGGSGSSGSDAGGSDDTGGNEDSEQASSSDSDEAMPPEVQRAVQAAKRRKAKRDAAAALPARTTAASITSSAASKVRLAALANLQRRPTAKTTDAPASTRVSLAPNPARGQTSDNDAGGTRVRPVKKARLRGPASSTKTDAVPFFLMSSSGRAPAPTGKPFTVLKSKPRAQGVSAGAFGSAKSGVVSASKSSAGAGASAGAASMFTSTPHGVVVSKRSGRMAGAKAGGGITVDMSGFFQRVLAMTVDWVVSPHYALVQLAQDGTPVAGTSLAGDVKAAAAVEAVASVPSDSLALVAVPAVFRSAVQYTSVFKRLLYEEVRAMLYQGLQWAARCGRLAATRQGSSGAANILAPRSRTTVASLLRPDALQCAPAETADGPLRVAVTATARGTGALQLLTKGTESDDSFFTLVFEVVTPVAPGKGAGARQAIEQGMLSTHASMGGFSHHDVVLLQPVVTEKMAKSAGSSAAATVFGVVAGTGDKDDAPGNRRPRSNGAALVRIKVLRRRVTGAVAVAMRTHSRWHCLALDNLTTCMREYVPPWWCVGANV